MTEEIIVDENIKLKRIGWEDVEIIFNTIVAEREYLREWLPFVDETKDISYTQTFVQSIIESPLNELVFTILFQNKFVGLIGTKDTDMGNKKTEIGYWLSEKYQRKGIMTKSCKTLTDKLFSEFGINRIQIKAADQNLKSQMIAMRLGFKKEGIEREGELHARGFVDLIVFGLLKNEWKKAINSN